MSHPILADLKHCTGCVACVDSCGKQALSMYVASDGHIYVSCNEDKCVLCHQCERVCPAVNGMKYSSNIKTGSEPFSVYCKDEMVYDMSTSGGAFAAMALQFIKEGGYVCGAVFDGAGVKHIVSNQKNDVFRMQGSKYMQSSLDGVYKEISALLKQGKKVLFCGMGCQGAALYSFFKKNKNRDLLYLVDMICGGVPSALLVKAFIENEPKYKQIVGYRRKGEYVLSCLNLNNEVEYLNYRTLPIVGFGSGLTNRYSCGDCQFCGIERLSDITIGDLWGPYGTGGKHLSVAIVHNSKGKNLLDTACHLSKESIDWSFIRYNYRCVIGKSINRFRMNRKLLAWNFEHLPYHILCGLYGCNVKNPIWIVYKTYCFIVRKLERFYISKQLFTILNKIS